MPKMLSTLIQVGLPQGSFAVERTAGRGLPVRRAGRQLVDRPRACRRGRLHHALELSAAPDRREGRTCARRGLHGRREAERGRSGQRVHPRRDHRRRRPSRGRLQPRVGRRSRRRRGDRLTSRRRHGVVHGLDPCRQARQRARGADRQARHPRARRQVGERHPRRCRLREGRRGRRGQVLPELGPDLLRAHAHAGAPVTARRGRGDRREDGRDVRDR